MRNFASFLMVLIITGLSSLNVKGTYPSNPCFEKCLSECSHGEGTRDPDCIKKCIERRHCPPPPRPALRRCNIGCTTSLCKNYVSAELEDCLDFCSETCQLSYQNQLTSMYNNEVSSSHH